MCAPCKIIFDQDVSGESLRTLNIIEQAKALSVEAFSEQELNAMTRSDAHWLRDRRRMNDQAIARMLDAAGLVIG